MRFVKVVVERSEHLSIPASVPAWEVPILTLIHGKEKVHESGAVVTVNREYPEAEVEFDRLQRRYGQFIKDEVYWVAKVYGEPPLGVRALAQAIAEERGKETAEEIDPLS